MNALILLDDARLWQVFSMLPKADTPLAAFPPGRGLLRVRHRPGTRFSYSNMGYTLLGMVIERIVGQRYERRLSRQDALAAPAAGVLALLLPLPLFYSQSFIQLGDLTLASGVLAAVTAALPVTMLIGLATALRRLTWRSVEEAAMFAVLQSCLVLAAWDLLPLRLWD